METFTDTCAQGDIYIQRIDALPDGLTKAAPEKNGKLIVTHSETGHHHVMDAAHVSMFSNDNPMVCYLYVEQPTALEHLRQFDTHAPISFQPGNYKVNRQREHTPEGWRRVED